MAGLPHQRPSTKRCNPVEQRLAGLHIRDDRGAGCLFQHDFGKQADQLIAPDDPPLAVDHADPVAIAIESHSEIELL